MTWQISRLENTGPGPRGKEKVVFVDEDMPEELQQQLEEVILDYESTHPTADEGIVIDL